MVGLFAMALESAKASEVLTNDKIQSKWTGPIGNARLGTEMVNSGDVNGDGLDDFVASVNNVGGLPGAWVLFGPVNPAVASNLSDLSPQDGYRIRTAGNITRSPNIGDQNGDGIDDIVVHEGLTATVVYGVADPATSLPKCDPLGTPQTRCLEVSDPVNQAGDRMGFVASSAGSITSKDWEPGDFNGDGKDEILLQNSTSNEVVVLANNLGSTCSPTPGLCTIDIDALAAPQAVAIEGPGAGITFGDVGISSPGDVNDDGRDDILTSSGTDGSRPPGLWVIYGQDWQSSPQTTSDLTDEEGYEVSMTFSSAAVIPIAPGDVNGDGIADIGVQSISLIPTQSQYFAVLFGQSGTPAVDLETAPPAEGTGVQYLWDASFGIGYDGISSTLGDLNGDGGDEFMVSVPAAVVGGAGGTGLAAIIQSHGSSTDNLVEIGPASPLSDAIVLTGSAGGQQFGIGIDSAGDINDDGVSDVAVSAPRVAGPIPAGGTAAGIGMVALVPSSRYYARATTGLAGSVDDKSAELSGTATANGRESVAYFEYGTGTTYGSETAEQPIGKLKAGKSVEADVSGLDPETEYHFRTVVVNDAGIPSYGPDRTFTTKEAPKPPPTQCSLTPTAPGCEGYCPANPTSAGCADKAGIGALIANSNASAVKRGKKAVISTWVTSTGTKKADGVKVCLTAPKSLIKGAKCQTVGSISPGLTVKKSFTVTVKKKAKKGKKATLKLTASADGLAPKTAKVKIKVK